MVERAIFEREDLTAHEKLVLCYLAMRANSESECWPSYNTIARDCSISRRSAINVVAALEEKGLLAKSSRSNDLGRFTSNLFRLFSAEGKVFPPSPDRDGEGGGATAAPSPDLAVGGAADALGGAAAAPGGATAASGVVQESHLYEQHQEEGLPKNARGRVDASRVNPALEAEAERALLEALGKGRRIANPAAYKAAIIRSLEQDIEQHAHLASTEVAKFVPAIAHDEFVCATCEGLRLVESDAGEWRACPACQVQPALF